MLTPDPKHYQMHTAGFAPARAITPLLILLPLVVQSMRVISAFVTTSLRGAYYRAQAPTFLVFASVIASLVARAINHNAHGGFESTKLH